MDLLSKSLAFALGIAFFFSFGWHFYLVNKLWGTSEYGGKIYKGALIKALASGLLLWSAMLIADWAGIPKETTKLGLIVAAPFLLVGWLLHMWKSKGSE